MTVWEQLTYVLFLFIFHYCLSPSLYPLLPPPSTSRPPITTLLSMFQYNERFIRKVYLKHPPPARLTAKWTWLEMTGDIFLQFPFWYISWPSFPWPVVSICLTTIHVLVSFHGCETRAKCMSSVQCDSPRCCSYFHTWPIVTVVQKREPLFNSVLVKYRQVIPTVNSADILGWSITPSFRDLF